ncbi:MAG: M13 family metallopeptidase [Deltaproteobacteria bacterium]|nr:M13 family metallopeptidase [Deltaproteobacteria bacterium]
MHIGSRLVISLSALGLAAACGSKNHPAPTPVATEPGTGSGSAAPTEPPPSTVPAVKKQLAEVGLDGGLIDRSVDPCDDFYQFACGNWIKQTEIAADKPMAMRSFVDIDDRNQEYLHDVLEQARTAPKGADAATTALGAFYGACMDEPAIAKAGIKPIAPLIAAIAKVKDGASLAAATTALHNASVEALFTFGPVQDARNATQVIGNIDQGGLGVPDRDYY